jgi:hypothetical protein
MPGSSNPPRWTNTDERLGPDRLEESVAVLLVLVSAEKARKGVRTTQDLRYTH